jgi:DNA-directed RNA polymerase specialized sigma24 family protein
MTEASGASVPGSDAELLNTIRSGDAGPFELLRARHAAAARYLAGHVVREPAAADAVVDVAFAQVLDAIRRGGGPTDAFRPYLLTAVRRAAREGGAGGAPIPTDEQQIPDPGQLLIDPAVASLEGSPAVPAFLSLPERWRAVLWHTEIEGATPAEAAPLLGLSAASVTELADRARDGLARAHLRLRLAAGEHEPAALADVGATLRQTVAPIVLGSAAAAYLAGLAEAGVAGPVPAARSGRRGRSAGAARRRGAAGPGRGQRPARSGPPPRAPQPAGCGGRRLSSGPSRRARRPCWRCSGSAATCSASTPATARRRPRPAAQRATPRRLPCPPGPRRRPAGRALPAAAAYRAATRPPGRPAGCRPHQPRLSPAPRLPRPRPRLPASRPSPGPAAPDGRRPR